MVGLEVTVVDCELVKVVVAVRDVAVVNGRCREAKQVEVECKTRVQQGTYFFLKK